MIEDTKDCLRLSSWREDIKYINKRDEIYRFISWIIEVVKGSDAV